MRWLMGLAAGLCLCIALLAVAYVLDGINDWHEARAVFLAELRVVGGDPGHPNRDSIMASAREQIDVMDLDVWKNSVLGALVLAIAIGAFLPLWVRAVRSFGAVRLATLVAVTTSALISVLVLLVVVLSAGLIRG